MFRIALSFINDSQQHDEINVVLPGRWLRLMGAIVTTLVLPFLQTAMAIDFDREIAPLLIDRCLGCHSGDEPKGGLNLTARESVLKGGDSGAAIQTDSPRESLLLERITAGEMPPDDPLLEHERALLREWILHGATWGTDPLDPFRYSTKSRAGYDWWALQPVRRPMVPGQGSEELIKNPIDAFVFEKLHERGLTPSPTATPSVLMRRLSFDLLGLPPRLEDVLEFETASTNDPEQAWTDLVERLLNSKHFGERWGRHWLDVVRYGESQGFERDKLRTNSWPYRDWVINAMNDDMPYDQFVRLQLAGDRIAPHDAHSVIATGFLVAGPWDEVGQKQQSAAMKAVVRQDELEDYIGTISQTFLGLTANCARCHDHKFDPISQKEYYQFAAALADVRHGDRQLGDLSVYAVTPGDAETTYVLSRGNAASQGEEVLPGGFAALHGVDADFRLAAESDDAQRRRALAAWITDPNNPLFARIIVNRLWHYHFGTGIVETPNDFGFNGGRPSHPELIDWLASELIDSGWSLKHIHRLIVTSATYQQSSRSRKECVDVDAGNRLLWRMSPQRLDAESLRDTILSIAGEINLQYGGAPYQDFETRMNNTQFYSMTDPDTPDACRRTVYRTWIRSGRNHFLDAFDCPDPSTTTPQRAVTTTPIQSLTLLNNSFVLRMSQRFADRVISEVGDDPRDQAQRVVELAYARDPSDSEVVEFADFISKFDLPALCRVIFNSNELIYVD